MSNSEIETIFFHNSNLLDAIDSASFELIQTLLRLLVTSCKQGY